jgi:hypothetical protein
MDNHIKNRLIKVKFSNEIELIKDYNKSLNDISNILLICNEKIIKIQNSIDEANNIKKELDISKNFDIIENIDKKINNLSVKKCFLKKKVEEISAYLEEKRKENYNIDSKDIQYNINFKK